MVERCELLESVKYKNIKESLFPAPSISDLSLNTTMWNEDVSCLNF